MATVPGIRVTGIAAGLHAVVELPEPRADESSVGEADTVAALAAAGVAVQGLGDYWHLPGRRPQGLVVGYGTPPEHDYPAALDALTTTLARVLVCH
jgi:GntR family transcriptional regulator/MocR family aminotransferase